MDRAAYLFMNWKSLSIWLDELSRAGFRLKNVIVWDKVHHGLNYQNYAHTHEFLIFAVKGRFQPKNKRTGDDSYRDLWHIRRELSHVKSEEFHHETVKPVALVARPIEHASSPGDLVLDPFAGSGRFLVVAKTLGRDYLGIERDPRFYRMGEAAIATVDRECSGPSARREARVHSHPQPASRGARLHGERIRQRRRTCALRK
jgi:DNA modification methylase